MLGKTGGGLLVIHGPKGGGGGGLIGDAHARAIKRFLRGEAYAQQAKSESARSREDRETENWTESACSR